MLPWPGWDPPTNPTREGHSPGLNTAPPGLLRGCGQNQLDLLGGGGGWWPPGPQAVCGSLLPPSGLFSLWDQQDTRRVTRPGHCVGVASTLECTVSGLRAPVMARRAVVRRSPAAKHPTSPATHPRLPVHSPFPIACPARGQAPQAGPSSRRTPHLLATLLERHGVLVSLCLRPRWP